MRVACGQMTATTMDTAADAWPAMDRLANQAAEQDADVLVFPETSYPAYWLESDERYRSRDIERSEGVLQRLSNLAARHGFWLVAGFVEEHDGRLFNSAAVLDRAGELRGVARKNFLWDCDNRWFSPGNRLLTLETDLGHMGVMICADGRAPEIAATLVARGAQFIIEPTAWVNASKSNGKVVNVQADFMIRARAMEFGIPIACSSKCGREGSNVEYVGQSQIVAGDGRVLAKAGILDEQLVIAEMTPADGRPVKLDEAAKNRLLRCGPLDGIGKAPRTCQISADATASDVMETVVSAGGRGVRMEAASLRRFVDVRCHALDGVHLVVAQGAMPDEAFLRTRAAENRIFVATFAGDAGHRLTAVIDPLGQFVWKLGDSASLMTLELSQAANKLITPGTHIWEQRRVECYEFSERKLATVAS